MNNSRGPFLRLHDCEMSGTPVARKHKGWCQACRPTGLLLQMSTLLRLYTPRWLNEKRYGQECILAEPSARSKAGDDAHAVVTHGLFAVACAYSDSTELLNVLPLRDHMRASFRRLRHQKRAYVIEEPAECRPQTRLHNQRGANLIPYVQQRVTARQRSITEYVPLKYLPGG